MTGTYWTRFWLFPKVVFEPGKYKTRCGEVVTIEKVDERYPNLCHGNYTNGIREKWHESGRIFCGVETGNDIVSKEE